MKKSIAFLGILLLAGCSAPTGQNENASSPPSSPSHEVTAKVSIAVSDDATCQTLLGGVDNQISEAAIFLTEFDAIDDEAFSKAKDIAEGLSVVAESASPDLADLLSVMQEPFEEMVTAVENGDAQFQFKAERFKTSANEVLHICEPLVENVETANPETSDSEDLAPSSAPSVESYTEEPEPVDESLETEEATTSQLNALKTANDYLDYSAFSKEGLIDQLIFEKYSKADATWAAENVSVSWNDQAALMADQYLDYSAYSRQGLIDQLVFEGFTKKQAQYGVKQTGL
ncbi:Ltp family lipoprotein [Glutamicibacter sp. AOP38-B1-38]|uniref:Ltp family lipoprotein n=1 Tax=Glutamicibacter sp. AOP38-B1-38 TaxID=3457680 RepID=UPI00403406FD